MANKTLPLFDSALAGPAITDAFRKLNPRTQLRNPVMLVVYVGSIFTTLLTIFQFNGFTLGVTLWLWFTVLFANFAEALAEGRSKAQAASLRNLKKKIWAKRILGQYIPGTPMNSLQYQLIEAESLRKSDLVLIPAGDFIPADGEILEGSASVDESAITGESAPVIRESGGDFSAVTGGTKVLSDCLVVRVTSNPGETFVDRMIAMVEIAKRQKTPNEIALTILLVALTIVFLGVVVTLLPFSQFSAEQTGMGHPVSLIVLVALLVCLIPTTIAGLLSAIGVAGMSRLMQTNVIATSGRAVEAAGDVDVLLLDKTGTITLGSRQASQFLPVTGISEEKLAKAAYLASLADETPEGRSIVVLAKEKFLLSDEEAENAQFVPFTAQTRMSGVDLASKKSIRKGAADAIRTYSETHGYKFPYMLQSLVDEVALSGSTPLVVTENGKPLGVVELKDIVKNDIKERFAELRKMGIKTVMVTGDNRLTAAAIAAEAGNMVDLDSNPTKLIEIVETGKQMLITRGSLTTFSIANDIAKYFAIVPAAFVATYPQLEMLNVMQLSSPASAILSAVIFNALIIICLIPLALRGVKYRPVGAASLLRRNLLIYGLGGVIAPFIGIKLIDIVLSLLGLA